MTGGSAPKALTPKEAMLLAIEEGKKGAGFVSPNPLVGCVILDREHRLLAKGYHARLGDLHAETHALKQVDDPSRLEGAHVFVTLEPCAHEGRQPSCAKHLSKLPLASVTYGLRDPNPLVMGKGADILRTAGLAVHEFGELKPELEELAEIFLLNQRRKRPFVAMKVATSLDGKTALPDGQSQWITGPTARSRVQFLRGSHDAVLTGAGTVLRDRPRLNSRDPRFTQKRQRLVILDAEGQLGHQLAGLPLMEVRRAEDVLLLTGRRIVTGLPIEQVELALKEGEFDFQQVMVELRQRDIHSVFLEAGERTLSAFLKARLADRLYVFLAPKLLGQGLGWTSGLRLAGLDQAVELTHSRMESIGSDWLFSGVPVWPDQGPGPNP